MRAVSDILRGSEGSKLRLPSTVVPIVAEDGSMLFLRNGSPLRIRGHRSAFRDLVERLNDSQSPSALINYMAGRHAVEPGRTLAWLEELRARGLLFEERTPPADPSVDWNRYARQLDFFAASETVEVSRFDRQRRLHGARVLQVGVGGLGTWIAQNLALAGIGHLALVDGDSVEHTNLSRQVLYTAEDVGAPKVLAASRAIRQLNPQISLSPHQVFIGDTASLEAVIGGIGLVIVSA